VGPLRGRGQLGRLAAGGGGGLLLAAEPTLQRPGTGQVGLFGVRQAQPQPQVGGAPAGVLFVQQQRLPDGRRRRGGRRVPVTGEEGVRRGAEADAEGAHRTLGKAELSGDGGGAGAALHLLEKALSGW
jgi:hypothetical protein